MAKTAIITASGKGTRSGLDYNKVFYKINNKTILELSVELFYNNEEFDEIIITANENDYEDIEKMVIVNFDTNKVKVVKGGETRQDSVCNAVRNSTNNIIFVHDGARPFLSEHKLHELVNIVNKKDKIECIALGIEVKDTINKVENGKIIEILDRNNLVALQTPQVINKDKYLELYNKNEQYTDESSMFVSNDCESIIFPGEETNIKITTKADIERIENDK